MISTEITMRWKGYHPDDISPGSRKRVWRICDDCGQGRWVAKHEMHDICKSCSDKRKAAINSVNNIGRKHSVESKTKMSAARKGIGKSRPVSAEDRERMSAGKQGIPYAEWEDFARNQPYCPLFNDACRESNREKYDRECFICGLPEKKNFTTTGKLRKLSVHHIDMNKMQGCDGKKWKLIPVCLHHHSTLHNDLWRDRISYLLNLEG